MGAGVADLFGAPASAPLVSAPRDATAQESPKAARARWQEAKAKGLDRSQAMLLSKKRRRACRVEAHRLLIVWATASNVIIHLRRVLNWTRHRKLEEQKSRAAENAALRIARHHGDVGKALKVEATLILVLQRDQVLCTSY